MNRFPSTLPPAFPPTLHEEIGSAHLWALELAATNRELHFSTDADGHVVVELRTLDGKLLQRIPPSLALEIINRGNVEEALRALRRGVDGPPDPAA